MLADTRLSSDVTLDWVDKSQFSTLHDARLNAVPAYCQGAFLEPIMQGDELAVKNSTDSERVKAFSNELKLTPGISAEFKGDVALRYEDFRLYSDSVIYRINENTLTLPDSIVLREPGFLLRGDRAFLDMDNGEVDFWNTTYVMHEQHAHGHAAQLRRKGDTTVIRRGTYTTCPPSEHPIWQLRTHKMTLDATSGWGSAQHARIEVHDVPVLYLPYMEFPIDDRRKTGLLFPSISNTAGGLDFSLPLYLNLAPNYDATLTPRYLNGRGTLFQNEMRYLNQTGLNSLSINALNNDRKILAAEQAAQAQNTPLSGVDPDRLYVNFRHAGQLSPKLSSAVHTEYVSDEEYFHDFGQDFQTSTQTYLDRSASLLYSDTYWSASAGLKGFQVIDQDIPLTSRPYSQLPVLTFNGHYPLSSQLDFLLQGEDSYFYRETTDPSLNNPEGDRLQLTPGLQAMFSSPWGHISPTLKVKQLSYWLKSEGPTSTEKTEDITVPVFSLDSGLFFERDVNWAGKSYRHTLDPRIFYLYSPQKNQQNLPNFDSSELTFTYSQLFRDSRFSGGDRIADYNQVSLGLSTSIASQESGNEVLNLSLGQAFFIENPTVRLLPDQNNPESSPISGSATVHLSRHWLLNNGFTWNGDINVIESNTLGIVYLGDIGELISVEFYSRERLNEATSTYTPSEQSKLGFAWPLHPQWKMIGYWHYNLNDQPNLEGDLSIENLLGLQYENCCVQIKLLNHRYLLEQFNVVKPTRQLLLQLELKGMANFDDRVSEILQRTLPNYQ
ncbi:MAG TPA: LPS-assembly protein LptD [Pseudomonadales bacterium]|nr:LPS-assembly protein LptD [Pseudomonadales bacterium]